METYQEVTEPLINGANVPKHPALVNSRKIVKLGTVRDARDGVVCKAALHQNELRNLMNGNQMGLRHLYRFGILNGKVFHTRDAVIIDCETEDVTDG